MFAARWHDRSAGPRNKWAAEGRSHLEKIKINVKMQMAVKQNHIKSLENKTFGFLISFIVRKCSEFSGVSDSARLVCDTFTPRVVISISNRVLRPSECPRLYSPCLSASLSQTPRWPSGTAAHLLSIYPSTPCECHCPDSSPTRGRIVWLSSSGRQELFSPNTCKKRSCFVGFFMVF